MPADDALQKSEFRVDMPSRHPRPSTLVLEDDMLLAMAVPLMPKPWTPDALDDMIAQTFTRETGKLRRG